MLVKRLWNTNYNESVILILRSIVVPRQFHNIGMSSLNSGQQEPHLFTAVAQYAFEPHLVQQVHQLALKRSQSSSGLLSQTLLDDEDQPSDHQFSIQMLAFQLGDTIQVIAVNEQTPKPNADPDWWQGVNTRTGQRGLFPSNYVQVSQASEECHSPSNVSVSYRYPSPSVRKSSSRTSRSQIRNLEVQDVSVDCKYIEKPEKTKYATYGLLICQLVGIASVLVGASCLYVAYNGLDSIPIPPGMFFRLMHLTTFVYAILSGTFTFLWDSFASQPKPLLYLALSLPLFLSPFTLLCGVGYLLGAFFQFLGYLQKESISLQDKSLNKRMFSSGRKQSFVRFSAAKASSKAERHVFVALYVLANVGLFAFAYNKFSKLSSPGNHYENMGVMFPWAKGFAYCLNFNLVIIVIPVCRTFIRILYDTSIQASGFGGRVLRKVLWFFPLDRALRFHEKTGVIVLICSFGHSLAHLIDAGLEWKNVLSRFGWSPLISGFILWIVMFFMFPGVMPQIRKGQFEIFWYSHQLFWLFFGLVIIHYRTNFNLKFAAAFSFSGGIYILERIYRKYAAYHPAKIISITNMHQKVLSIEFCKSVFSKGYLEGQYCFICCPFVSKSQWHPFTISSAPGEETVTLHIKVYDSNSWTRKLLDYLTFMGPPKASYFEFADSGPSGIEFGKRYGPRGEDMLLVYGPFAAPTQHFQEYPVDIVIGSGIGITPVSATMQQLVFHRWKNNLGDSNPQHAYFVWICSHKELPYFTWMMRTVKECQDYIDHLRSKNPYDMEHKTFQIDIFVTSTPHGENAFVLDEAAAVQDDIGFWGRPRKCHVASSISELSIYKAMLNPPKGLSPTVLGDVRIFRGRPTWDNLFSQVAGEHQGSRIGVMFCGNPTIGTELRVKCAQYSKTKLGCQFYLHKEIF
jgi:NAD(P)H-flavin reductase